MAKSSDSPDNVNIAPPRQPAAGARVHTAGVALIAGIVVFAGGVTAQAAVATQAPEAAPKPSATKTAAPKEAAPKESPEAEVKRLQAEVDKLQAEIEEAQKCVADKASAKNGCPSVLKAQQALKIRRQRLKRARKKESASKKMI